MLNIITKSEHITVDHIVAMVYGEPGVGKTSLAFTSSDPLLLDFDQGAHRSGFRKDSVRIARWEEIRGMEEADLADYSTIVVDTVGRLLDKLSVYIVQQNPKMGRGGGALTLQGYGELKAEYTAWLNTLRSYGKDVLLLAHDKEDKSGDELTHRPDMQGGSYNEVFKSSDIVGFMHRVGKDTRLDFSPSDRWAAKNAAGFDSLVVPNFTKSPDYMAGVIQQTKDALNEMSAEAKEIMETVEAWRADIMEAQTAESLHDIITKGQEVGLAGPASKQVWHLIQEQGKALGLRWDKESKQFDIAEAA